MSTPEERGEAANPPTTELPPFPPREPDATSAVLRVTKRSEEPAPARPDAPPDEPDAPGREPTRPGSAEGIDSETREFPTVWRGYDPSTVDAHVRQLHRTIDDLRSTQTPQDVVRKALDRIGEETAAILREAEATAERLTAQSRSDAATRVARAESESEAITRQARERLRELDQDIDRIWLERERLIEDTRKLADALLRVADAAEERFPAEEESYAERAGVAEAGDAPPAGPGRAGANGPEPAGPLPPAPDEPTARARASRREEDKSEQTRDS